MSCLPQRCLASEMIASSYLPFFYHKPNLLALSLTLGLKLNMVLVLVLVLVA